jgi:starch-binding outer membrane protein, SusD/RagB family
MKKYIFLIILISTVSCNTFFQQEDEEYLVIENKQEIIDLLNGIYSNLVITYNANYFTALCRSDDINLYRIYQFNNCSMQYGEDFEPIFDNIYSRFYKVILNVNSTIPQLSEAEVPELLGELYMLRAYAYFSLSHFYGNPYLVKNIDVNYILERPTYLEVYEYIEQDMLNALRLLPDTYTKARIPGETPHKGTAKALLAEIYLCWAGYPINDNTKYVKAAQYSGDVIQNEDYYGYGLLDDFAELWKVNNQHNKEYVFGLFYNSDYAQTKNTLNSYSAFKYNDGYVAKSFRYHSEFKFYNSIPNNYRKKSSFIIDIDPLINPCEFISDVMPIKWIDTIELHNVPTNTDNRWGSEVTVYLFRYAQTLLTYAEARARSGILDDSTYEAVDRIRRRANKLDSRVPSEFDLQKNLTSEQFIDSVVWERAWELFFEPNGRWFDVIRLDLRQKLKEYSYDFDFPDGLPLVYLQDNWYFYKLP